MRLLPFLRQLAGGIFGVGVLQRVPLPAFLRVPTDSGTTQTPSGRGGAHHGGRPGAAGAAEAAMNLQGSAHPSRPPMPQPPAAAPAPAALAKAIGLPAPPEPPAALANHPGWVSRSKRPRRATAATRTIEFTLFPPPSGVLGRPYVYVHRLGTSLGGDYTCGHQVHLVSPPVGGKYCLLRRLSAQGESSPFDSPYVKCLAGPPLSGGAFFCLHDIVLSRPGLPGRLSSLGLR